MSTTLEFEAFLDVVAKRIGVESVPMKHKNVGRTQRRARHELSAADREAIAEHFDEDRDLFEYVANLVADGAFDHLLEAWRGHRAAEIAECIEALSDHFDKVMGVNVKGAFFTIQKALPHLLERGGNIVNVASTAGIMGQAYMASYCASKHAVIGITKVASGEVARQGVRVNCVCPGPVQTRMIDSVEAQISPGDPAAAKARYQAGLPTGRYTTPEEIADAVLFLSSDHALNITGSQFVVDGGRTATGGAATVLASE